MRCFFLIWFWVGFLLADQTSLAIFPFAPQSELAQTKVDSFTTILWNKFNQTGQFQVLPPLVLAHHLEKCQRTLQTNNPYSIALELKKQLSIDWLVIPSLVLEKGYSSINILLLEGTQGKLLQTYQRESSDQMPAILAVLEELSQQMTQDILGQSPHTRIEPNIPVEITDSFLHAERFWQQGNTLEALKYVDFAFQKGTNYLPVLLRCLDFYKKQNDSQRISNVLAAIRQHPESQSPDLIELLMQQYESLGYGIPALEMSQMWLALPQNAQHPKRAKMLAYQEQLQLLAKAHDHFNQLHQAYQAKQSERAWEQLDCIKKTIPTHPWLADWEKRLHETLPRLKTFYQKRLVFHNELQEDLYVYARYAVQREGKWVWFPSENQSPLWWKVSQGQLLKVNDTQGQPIITHSALIWAESVRKVYNAPVISIDTNRYKPLEITKKEGYQAAQLEDFKYRFYYTK